jgi:hypothetical protein
MHKADDKLQALPGYSLSAASSLAHEMTQGEDWLDFALHAYYFLLVTRRSTVVVSSE